LKFSSPDPTLDNIENEEEILAKQEKAKNEFTKEDRIEAFNTASFVNQLVKNSPLDSNQRVCHI
jgi:hypothetical protein